MATSWFVFERVGFAYGRERVFEDLSFSVDGDCRTLGVLGESGVGKSTLLNLAAGFVKPDRGSIVIHGATVTAPGAERPVVFQDHNLFPWMSVLDNVCFGLKARGENAATRHRSVASLIEETGLSGHEHKYPRELSGGMQQRVGLARALAITPSCLLLDEPFGALDETTRASVQDVFGRVIREHAIHTVHVTHDPDEAVRLCDTILVLAPGHSSRLIDRVEGLGDGPERRARELRRILAN